MISLISRNEGFTCEVDRVPGGEVDAVTEALMDVGAVSVR